MSRPTGIFSGQELTHEGYSVLAASDGREALRKIESSRPDLIILDYMMPDLSGLEVLKELRKRENDTPVVMITAYGTMERAVEAMKEGAYDFITRPFEPDHIALVVRKALERQRLKRGVEILSEEVEERYHLVVGESAKMKQAVDLAKKAASSNATVLLLGESGTGKEIFARSIHNWSERKDDPLSLLTRWVCRRSSWRANCSATNRARLPARTGVRQERSNWPMAARSFSTRSAMSLQELQAKLLRFLQEREFERVGGVTPISVDVRVIAATNRNLERFVKEGQFREDLYYRLNVVAIHLPPLRERQEDIAAVSQYFLRKHSVAIGRNITGISEEAQRKLEAYDWPGNVRELANVIERALVLGSGPTITLEDVPGRIAAGWTTPAPGIHPIGKE